MPVRVPKYRFHKASGQAIVEIRGRHFYLGKYDSPESHEEYKRKIAVYLSQKGQDDIEPSETSITIDKLVLKYFHYAKTYYIKNGEPTDEITSLRIVLRRLRSMYGSTEAVKFGPKAFKTFRESLIQERLSRKYINDSMSRVRRMFRWGVAEELMPPAVHQGLSAVPGLRKRRSAAKETERILPVADEVVEATLPFLTEVVADMVRLQKQTGMRPKEVCILRLCDIDCGGEVWTYQPHTHKTEHADKDRKIPIGAQAQAILFPYMDREAKQYCFRPIDSESRRRALMHARRKTPLSCGNRPGTNQESTSLRSPGEHYTTASYRRSIHRACDKAFPHPTLSSKPKADLKPGELVELRQWQSEHRWSPNQLRHALATLVRQRYGLEAAQVVLGHSAAAVTEIYAERDYELAKSVAKEIG